ncbi:shikimate dehydrogenase [Legionella sp. km772]|uniref:shikimate dehydrogenase n=1 Tax=Legionella sp. km772 TaxID=2498111 RepID=UPI000F8C7938|nr:shikimate dehydrogenase [Legionella sp. km772]RUR13960.1 shikimate dehydrogenase [Legionella sp. km772]
MSLRCAVIGNPIAHSLSPRIHHAFAQQFNLPLLYERILGNDLTFEQQVFSFFAAKGRGLNVTLPFKQRAFMMANSHSARCAKAGAANTLWYEDNKLCADNTDGVGLIRDLCRYLPLQNSRILILGAGGAARGIIHPLLEMQPHQLVVANRSLEPLAQLQAEIAQIRCLGLTHLEGEFDLIINATSAGVLGDSLIIPKQVLQNRPFCYDLAYRYQALTPFVDYTQQLGCEAVDGLGMLVEQAAEAFYLWHRVRPDTQAVLNSL